MLYLDALLVSNGGDTPGQLLQLTKAGGHDRKIHSFTLRSGPDAFKLSRKTGRPHGRFSESGLGLFFYLSCHVDSGQDSAEMRNWMRARQFLAGCWLPLVLMLVVYTASLFLREIIKELTLAPLLSLLSLFALAMFRPPGFVLVWIFPFVLLSYFLILPYAEFVWTHTLTLLLGGMITAYASYLRTRAAKLSASLDKLFSRITHPIIVSDVTSKILFFNQAACEALKIPESELRGFSWFNLIMDQGNKARDIERYVRLGLSEGLADKEAFRLVGLDGKSWEAMVIKEGSNKEGRLITTLK
jgi:PAS domain-containing protein